MRWTVTYTPAAEAELTRLYSAAVDQRAFSQSSNRIDSELKVDAQFKGIPFGTARIYSDDPLAVLYELNPGDCKVTVVAVKIIT